MLLSPVPGPNIEAPPIFTWISALAGKTLTKPVATDNLQISFFGTLSIPPIYNELPIALSESQHRKLHVSLFSVPACKPKFEPGLRGQQDRGTYRGLPAPIVSIILLPTLKAPLPNMHFVWLYPAGWFPAIDEKSYLQVKFERLEELNST